ncbi:hypothetical protein CBY09_04950 [Acidovorax kalamii]|uniref:Uncharacterized protein n=1 Tax=Acidovorax kalamii TaxID=2004485 RepID=A0A235EQ90_9BURK|nr:hypothetical protein CBY09_04950 [Acidovorax kalamii]
MRRFPLLSNCYAIREGGHRQRGGAALARRSLAWAARAPRVAGSGAVKVGTISPFPNRIHTPCRRSHFLTPSSSAPARPACSARARRASGG